MPTTTAQPRWVARVLWGLVVILIPPVLVGLLHGLLLLGVRVAVLRWLCAVTPVRGHWAWLRVVTGLLGLRVRLLIRLCVGRLGLRVRLLVRLRVGGLRRPLWVECG